MKRDTTGPAAAAVHIVCADLILAGHKAMMAPEGLSYDVVLDAAGKLYRVQVKSTAKPSIRRQNASPLYRFATTRNHRPEIHGTKASVRHYTDMDADILACVAIDLRVAAYFKISGRFVGGLHLYPPGTAAWLRNGTPQRRIIDGFPIDAVLRDWQHSGPPTLAYGPALTSQHREET